MKSSENFKASSLDMLLLYLLHESDMYGYQLFKLIQHRSKNMIEIPEQSIYITLYRLVEKGYITDKLVYKGKRKTIREYHIEPEGQKYHQKLYNDYKNTQKGVQNIYNYSRTKGS